jgi:hypothetical protein
VRDRIHAAAAEIFIDSSSAAVAKAGSPTMAAKVVSAVPNVSRDTTKQTFMPPIHGAYGQVTLS